MNFQRHWLAGAAIVAAVFLVFSNALSSEFLNWDDNILIFQNPYYRQARLENLWHFWQHPYQKLYMPLTYTIWGILADATRLSTPIYTAVGESFFPSWPFHAANLALHSLNALLVFVLLQKLRFSAAGAVSGALLWGLHPLQVESVCWAAEFKGVLCGTFVLGSLNYYAAFVVATARNDSPDSSVGKPRKKADALRSRRDYLFATLCFACALLSKPSAVALPLCAWILDVGLLRRDERDSLAQRLRRATRTAAPLFMAAGLWIFVARHAQPIDVNFWHPLWSRPFVAGDAFSFYLLKTLWPTGLTMDYGRTPYVALSQWTGYASWVLTFGTGVLVWRTRDARLRTAFALSIAVLLPNSGIVPFIYQAISTVADRYAYLALLGPAVAFACLWERAEAGFNSRLVHAGGALVLAVLAGQTFLQSLVWSNDISLCTHVLQVNPRSYLAHTVLATALLGSGRFDEALKHAQEAVEINPGDLQLRANKAAILLKKGGYAEATQAIEILRQVLRAHPDDAVLNFRLANALMRQGRSGEAVPFYQKCLQINPEMAAARDNLAVALMQSRRTP